MNSFNLVFIVAIFAVTIFFANCDDDAYYQKLRKLAIGCKKDTKTWKDPNSPCNSCSCMSDGVIICTRMKCDKNYNPKDELEGNPESELEPEPDAEPEPEPNPEPEPMQEAEPEPEPEAEVESQSGDAKDTGVYEKLRNDATGCTPGSEVPTDPCAGCICILPGVMRCTNVNCLVSDGAQKLGCLGFDCYNYRRPRWDQVRRK